MGNNKAKIYRSDYLGGSFDQVIEHQDTNLGKYMIFKFHRDEKSNYFSKTMNPQEYDNYSSDVDEFAKKLLKNNPGICEFCFVEPNRFDPNLYDLVFEFGDCLNRYFTNEKVIWTFISHMLNGLLFLQNEGFHYPALRKKYTIYQSDKSAFKLLNPHCFSKYIENLIAIYLNSSIGMTEKRNFQNQNIIRNIKEFGIMILSLIKDVDESHFFKTPTLIKQTLVEFKRNRSYSDKLINFLIFSVENRTPMNFHDIAKFISIDLVGHELDQFQQSYFSNTGGFYFSLNTLSSIPRMASSQPITQPALPNRMSYPAQPEFYSEKALPNNAIPHSAFDSDKGINYQSSNQIQNANHMMNRTNVQVERTSQPGELRNSLGQVNQDRPNKKVKRIVMKWSQEANAHKEYYEYEDGTMEEKCQKSSEESQKILASYGKPIPSPMAQSQSQVQNYSITPQMSQTFSQSQFSQQSSMQKNVPPMPQNVNEPKKSVMNYYDTSQPPKQAQKADFKQKPWNIVLISDDHNDTPRLILTANITETFEKYNYMKGIIDRGNQLKPSVYHNVEGGATSGSLVPMVPTGQQRSIDFDARRYVPQGNGGLVGYGSR